MPTISALPSPFYYLDNFQRVLDWVAQRYSDLLSEEESTFIHQFSLLPQPSRALLVRMIMRKGDLFRFNKLRYAEITCTDTAAKPLINAKWVTRNPSLTIEQLFRLLSKPEIIAAFNLPATDKSLKKSVLQEKLQQTSTLAPWSEPIYQVNVTSLCERIRLMFFGNMHQDWTEFVLSDLGIYRYESVEFSPSSRAFCSRQDIDDYLHLYQCRERLDADQRLDEILSDIPKRAYENTWIESRRSKLLFQIAQQYERDDDWQTALDIYNYCNYPGARLRTIRILEKNGNPAAAWTIVQIALKEVESESEHQALLRVLPRLQRKLGHCKTTTAKRHTIDEITLTLAYSESVEQAVQAHLSCKQQPVRYVENALINSLFGLLCWPAIFAALPGAFFHPFHHGPADLRRPDFFQRRQLIFAACLSELDTNTYQKTIVDNFHAKFGIQSPFVFWEVIDEALLKLALGCISATHLKRFFERILWDISANRSGLPDLIQFWPEEKRYRLLEVKGPGDRLQDNQIRWMHYCIDHGMPVAVCYVQWEGQMK